MQNRRHFIKRFSLISSVVTFSTLSGCSTIDEHLITDPNDLGDTVIIVGGGISGLYAAYQLRKRKIPYRIFEASNRLGGQILSDQGFEYGAFNFLNSDSYLLALAKDLNIKTEKLDNQSWIFKNGTADFLSQMTERIGGVLPLQQIRLKSKLIQFEQTGSRFKVTFANERSDKTFRTSRLLLALPAHQLFEVNGLSEKAFEQQFASYWLTRVVLPIARLNSKGVSLKSKTGVIDQIHFSIRVVRNLVYINIKGAQSLPNYPLEVEMVAVWIADNIFNIPKFNIQIQPENIYVWSGLVGKNPLSDLRMSAVKNRLVISDGLVHPVNRIESLLASVNQQIDDIL